MAGRISVVFRYVPDDSMVPTVFSKDASLVYVRQSWGELTGLDPSRYAFSGLDGNSLPEDGVLSDLPLGGSFVFPVEVEPLQGRHVSVLGKPHLVAEVDIHSNSQVNDVIKQVQRQLNLGERSLRILHEGKPLSPEDFLPHQEASKDLELLADLEFKFRVEVVTSLEFEEPELDEDGNFVVEDDGTIPCHEVFHPPRSVKCFGSSPVSDLFDPNVSPKRQRLQVGRKAFHPGDLLIDIVLDDADVLRKKRHRVCLEFAFPIQVQTCGSVGDCFSERLVWPSQTVASLVAGRRASVFCEGVELHPRQTLLEAGLQSWSLVRISETSSLTVTDSRGRRHFVRIEKDATVFDLRQRVGAFESSSDFSIVCDGRSLENEVKTLGQCGVDGRSSLRLTSNSRRFVLEHEGQRYPLGDVRASTELGGFLRLAEKALDCPLPADTELECACGRKISARFDGHRSLPLHCCDREEALLEVHRPIDVVVNVDGRRFHYRLATSTPARALTERCGAALGRRLTDVRLLAGDLLLSEERPLHQLVIQDRLEVTVEERLSLRLAFADGRSVAWSAGRDQQVAAVLDEVSRSGVSLGAEDVAVRGRRLRVREDEMRQTFREFGIADEQTLTLVDSASQGRSLGEHGHHSLSAASESTSGGQREVEESSEVPAVLTCTSQGCSLGDHGHHSLSAASESTSGGQREVEESSEVPAVLTCTTPVQTDVSGDLKPKVEYKEVLVYQDVLVESDARYNWIPPYWRACFLTQQMIRKKDYPPAEFYIRDAGGVEDFFLILPRSTNKVRVISLRDEIEKKIGSVCWEITQWTGESSDGQQLVQIWQGNDSNGDVFYDYANKNGKVFRDNDVKNRRHEKLDDDDLLLVPGQQRTWIEIK